MFKSVIFDMDGVIIDSEPIHFKVEKKLFRDLGLAVPEDEHHLFVGSSSAAMWSYIKDKYKPHQSIEELIEMQRTRYMDCLLSQKSLKPIAGVTELIKELSSNRVRLAVASSASIRNIEVVLKMFNLERFFEEKVSGAEVDHGKPAPDIFLRAAKIIGVQPEQCIAIDDSKNGVEAASSAGMMCIGFKNANSGKQDLSSADIIINSFSEINYQTLRKIYKQWQKQYSQ